MRRVPFFAFFYLLPAPEQAHVTMSLEKGSTNLPEK
jgi:hypothetical protein